MYLPEEIQFYILEFVIPKPKKLLDWIPKEKLDWSLLSATPVAIDLLKANSKKIDWGVLSKNPAIFEDDNEKYKEIIKKLLE